jgi:hypothetical protein
MNETHEVISAFLDDEPFDASRLVEALSDPAGRDLLIDLIALRHLVEADDKERRSDVVFAENVYELLGILVTPGSIEADGQHLVGPLDAVNWQWMSCRHGGGEIHIHKAEGGGRQRRDGGFNPVNFHRHNPSSSGRSAGFSIFLSPDPIICIIYIPIIITIKAPI